MAVGLGRCDRGILSSNCSVLALAEVEKRVRVADLLARCIDDPRCPGSGRPQLDGYDRLPHEDDAAEDGNDAHRLRFDPAFKKMAQGALFSGRDLASQSTMCWLENLPEAGAGCDGAGYDRPLLRLPPAGAEADRAQHRRHV
ncbi:transposase [Bradyrhizobium neotropicale]|uniref:transposase n=1 Tax=Bradyrhizobium neotropicale TaxID=1497615 RepID=UPI003D317F60